MNVASTTRSRVVTLTSDFGIRDHYVGAMKGVIARIDSTLHVVDITHEIPSYDIAEGAFAIAQAYRFFPEGTVHVVVVDPGVGTSRRPLAVAADGHFFIAPDNGLLSQVLEGERFEARCIQERHGLGALSRTFHGRDLFAPVGARLAAGLPFQQLGPLLDLPQWLPPRTVTDGLGRVLHIDGFGNIVTSFRERDLPRGACLAIGSHTICLRADSYAAAPEMQPFLIIGSSGFLEVALNRNSAARALGVRAGAEVVRIRNTSEERRERS